MHDVEDREMWRLEGIDSERQRIKNMIQKVISNPSIEVDRLPARLALQVLMASLEPDNEGETNDNSSR